MISELSPPPCIFPEFSQERGKEKGQFRYKYPEISRLDGGEASDHLVSSLSGSGLPITTSVL